MAGVVPGGTTPETPSYPPPGPRVILASLPLLQAPNVAQELSGGCHGFSHKFMHWQEELLLGGMARDPQGQLLR